MKSIGDPVHLQKDTKCVRKSHKSFLPWFVWRKGLVTTPQYVKNVGTQMCFSASLQCRLGMKS